MRLDDYTFAFLAKAISDAGGSVFVSNRDLLRLNNGYMVDIDATDAGTTLTLRERPKTSEAPTLKQIIS